MHRTGSSDEMLLDKDWDTTDSAGTLSHIVATLEIRYKIASTQLIQLVEGVHSLMYCFRFVNRRYQLWLSRLHP